MTTQRPPLSWAVIGVGIAGRARARAILGDPRSRLVAVHRGRHAVELDVPDLPLLEALDRADAVAICSPSDCHADQVALALERGRHVVVEFPLASTRARAAALLAQARAAARLLHVEHIELLDPAQVTLAAQARPETLRTVDIAFQAPGDPLNGPAELALANVARLHRIVHLGGPVARVEELAHGPGLLEGTLTLATGVPVRFRFACGPGLRRSTRLHVEGVHATWLLEDRVLYRDEKPQTLLAARPLFVQDHRIAMARLLDGRSPYVSEERILHVLHVVDHLGALATGEILSSAR